MVICVLVGEFHIACSTEAPVPCDPSGRRLLPKFYSETVSGCPLEPLARVLADSEDLERLDRRARSVFAAVSGGAGEVEPAGLGRGLRRLCLMPPVLFEPGDWARLVRGRGLCGPGKGGPEVMGEEGFLALVRGAVRRHLVFAASGWADGVQGERDADRWAAGGVRRVLTGLRCRLMQAAEEARRADEGVAGVWSGGDGRDRKSVV